jgi:4-hydroxybenzoyl-CoA thioesterase
MAYVQNLRVRFEEVDFARIVYFPRLFGYCHSVFEDFFEKEVGLTYADMLIKRHVGFPAVRAEGDFKSPLRFGDLCRVVMETTYLGRRSVTCGYHLYLAEKETLCAEMEIVSVVIDMDKFQSRDIPEDVSAAFLRHLAKQPESGH